MRIGTPLTLPFLLPFLPSVFSQVTVYTGIPGAASGTDGSNPSATAAGPGGFTTNLPAYDTTRLTGPAPISPPLNSYSVGIPSTDLLPAERPLSKPIRGNLLGFSVELSIADSILGTTGEVLKPQFLNYLANIQHRAGVGPQVRVGGNSQEGSSIFVEGTSNGRIIEKIRVSDVVTATPIINYSPSIFDAMLNISSNTDAEWFFGISFNETAVSTSSPNGPLAAQYAAQILGTHLKGLQIGNEPDLYVDHQKRPAGWTVQDYVSEFGHTVDDINAGAPAVAAIDPIFMGPSLCCERVGFELPDVMAAGWLTQHMDTIGSITVQNYPENNCGINGQYTNPQDVFYRYLNHTSAEWLTAQYADVSQAGLENNKNLVMMEMNTASCGGFPGLSDSFGAAMWAADWALQLGTYNFTTVLMHVGGQNVYYNPFTPPPSNMSRIYEWTTGSVYYSTLLVAELFGKSENSRIVDMTHTSSIPVAVTTNYNEDGSTYDTTSSDDMYHPSYLVYDGDTPSRIALFNFISDPTGASDSQVTLNFNNTAAPSSVSVRYLRAPEVEEQYNITWAGQTMGTSFTSDGTLRGDRVTDTITCSNGVCVIPVYAPSVALVFLTDDALTSSTPGVEAAPFATTVIGTGDATVDPRVLETSNGQNGGKGSTSKGSIASNDGRSRVKIEFGLSSLLAGFGLAAFFL